MTMISVLDNWLEPVITPDVARRLVALRADAATSARIEELGQKANEARLSPREQAEYESYIDANDFIAILQAKARKVLRQLGE
jgi:hypothetical protein